MAGIGMQSARSRLGTASKAHHQHCRGWEKGIRGRRHQTAAGLLGVGDQAEPSSSIGVGGTGQALSLLLGRWLLPWLDTLPRKHVGCVNVMQA